MRILIATDGSRLAQEAVRFGVVLGAALDAELALVGVADASRRIPELRGELEGVAERLTYARPIPVNVLSGRPAERILAASAENVDLLIVGARARGRFSRLLLGDTAQRLAREVRIPMIIVRRSRPVLRRILVCTAGGEHGRVDAEYVAGIAAQAGATVVILHVMSQVAHHRSSGWDQLSRPADWHREHGTREGIHLDSLATLVAEHGVQVETKLREGLVVEEILEETRGGDYDLVAVGAHGGVGRQRYLLDDVTEEIIANLNRPVLIVR
jgi:nucleotide-binding universal stress UspA family protein